MKFAVFGGGGKVARHFTKLAIGEGHEVVSIVRDDTHVTDLETLQSTPLVLSLESTSLPDLTSTLSKLGADTIIFSAGSGGKGGPERTRAVDYEGAVKVFDAMEAGGVGRRLIYVGAVDVRDRERGMPEWYDENSAKQSDRMWKAIPAYMKAKYEAELELHQRKQLQYTVIRPGGLTDEPSGGVEMGITQIRTTSRETVAKAILACASEPRTAGLTIDVMDGSGTLEEELKKVVNGGFDAWTG